jgi:hypothetical protein
MWVILSIVLIKKVPITYGWESFLDGYLDAGIRCGVHPEINKMCL